MHVVPRRPRGRALVWLVFVAGLLPCGPLAAQAAEPATIRWWQVAAATGVVGALFWADEPTARWVADHRGDGLARAARHFGQVETYLTVGGGLLVAGWVSGDRELQAASYRVAGSLALAGATVSAAKYVIGRSRPNSGADADAIHPFSGATAMPSGHTTMAFALATSLSDEIHHPAATVGLYVLAGATGWSRLNDNKHWLSDIAAGAVMGITSAKIASGRWRIFGWRPPTATATSSGVRVGWSGSF